MIDRRKAKSFGGAVEEDLSSLSDYEIMLNFASSLQAVWPYAANVHLNSYDPWEEFVDAMFDHLVIRTFCWKYGLTNVELGIQSLAYPSRNSSKIQVTYNSKTLLFKLFGYPGVDLCGPASLYFGKDSPLKSVDQMMFSHALCSSDERSSIWLPIDDIFFELILMDS